MDKETYRKMVELCERMKLLQSSSKLIRGFRHLIYLTTSALENKFIKGLDIKDLNLNTESRTEKIVVSLTTFPARIDECGLVIKSLMAQTMVPDRIVLWLADEQFEGHQLPEIFSKLIEKGVEVRYSSDLRSHKKYFYMLQEQKPDELVITFDDDIIYHPKSIERAYRKHLQYPNAIVSNEVKGILIDKSSGNFLSYGSWLHPGDCIKSPKIDYSVMSGSGCLYPYNVFPKEMFNWDIIQKTALSADDLWITMMAKYYDVDIVGTDISARVYSTISNSQTFHLGQVNCIGDGNDVTMKRISETFPTIKQKFL